MKHVILNLLLFLVAFAAKAGEITTVNYISIADAVNMGGGTMSAADYTYIGPNNATNPSYVVSRKALVNLIYGRESQTDAQGLSWSLTVQYQISYPGSTANAQIGYLTVSSSDLQGDHQAYIEYANVSENALVEILSINTNGTNPPVQDIRLELKLTSEGYFNLSETLLPDIASSYDAARFQTDVSWPYIVGAEEYDLEWVFLDDELNNQGYLTTDELFENNAVRVRITNNFYQVPMYYPKGKVLFRVRAVGRHILGVGTDYTYIKYGAWSNNFSENKGQITINGFNTDKNWQYGAVFSDDGKRKETITYADNTLRQRQVQTNLSTDEMTVVGETVYDFEGRASVSILPAPAAPGIQNLDYKPNFNMAEYNGSLYTYSASHFDRVWGDISNNRYARPLWAGSGAGSYFSSNNPFTGKLYRDYTPDAGGYPIIQVSLLRDGTGRVRDQGGLGSTFQIYNENNNLTGHATRYVYGTPSDTELRRLFGKNVGEAKYYKKQVVIDPNGQASVSYLDMQDRVVATALIGQSPGNVIQLDSETPSTATLTHSLNASNIVDNTLRTRSSVNYIVHAEPAPQDYEFVYNMTGVDDILAGTFVRNSYPGLCASCVYELEITIQDQDGNYVGLNNISAVDGGNLASPNGFVASFPGTSLNYIKGVIQAANACNGTSYAGPTIRFKANISTIGAYKVTKTLRVINDPETFQGTQAWQTVSQQILAQQTTDAINALDLTICDITCEQHCASQVGNTNSPAYSTCIEQCNNLVDMSTTPNETYPEIEDAVQTGSCQSMLAEMTHQILPSAGLAPGILSAPSGQLNMFVEDRDGISHTINLSSLGTGQAVSLPTNDGSIRLLSSIADLYNTSVIWQPEWEDVLVKLHPEYCHYELCMTDMMQQYRASQFQFSLIDDWAEGVSAGLVPNISSPLTVTAATAAANALMDHDPFLSNANASIFNSTANVTLPAGLRLTIRNAISTRIVGFISASNSGCTTPTAIDLFSYASGSACSTPYTTSPSPATKWHTFMGIYNSIKSDALENALHHNANASLNIACSYLNTDNAVVQAPPILGSINSTNIATHSDPQILGDNCFYNCEANVDHWISVLTNSINTNTNTPCAFSTADLATLRNHLGRYCMRSCMSMTNPLGIITANAIVNTTDPDLIIVSNVLANYTNCAVLGIPDAGNTQTLLQGLVATNTTYSDTIVNINFNCSGCEILGHFVDMSSTPTQEELEGASEQLSLILGYTVDTSSIKLAISICNNPAGSHPRPGEALLTSLQTALPCQSSVAVVTGINNTNPLPVFDPIEAQQDCIDFLTQEATYNATQAAIQQTDAILNELYFRIDACLQLSENFTYTAASTEHHYTLYYYDQAGSLVRTVPPIGVHPLNDTHFPNGAWDGTNPTHTETTTYKYDALGNIREKETPDAGFSKTWFDNLKRAHFAQDARQVALGNTLKTILSYTKYDNLGRIGEIGEMTINSPINSIDLDLLANTQNFPLLDATNTVINLPGGLTGTVAYRTETIYGDSPEALLNPPTVAFQQENLRGRVMLSRNESQITRYDYDPHGNVRQLRHEYIFLGNIVKDLRYEYDLISGKTIKLDYQPNVADERFIHRYRYDADNRITHAYTSRDGIVWDQDARYFYYLHGLLARTEIGEDHVQGQDRFYNLQGWIKGINTPGAKDASQDVGLDGEQTQIQPNSWFATDAFAYGLGYYKDDYVTISGNTSPVLEQLQSSTDILTNSLGESGLFNGNITAMVTQLKKFDINSGDRGLHGFVYQYDALNRIKEARSNTYGAGNWLSSGLYNSGYKYDANGNIYSLQRQIPLIGGSTTSDNLNYHYNPNKPNQLDHVKNYATASPNSCAPDNFVSQSQYNYRYDAIGNLVIDNSEGISNITWDIYGKVRRVQFGLQNTLPSCLQGRKDVTYRYDPTGNRSLKFNNINANGSIIGGDLYVRDPQGNVLAVYGFTKDQTVSLLNVKEWDIYGSSRIGLRRYIATAEDPETNGGLSVGGKSYDWTTDQLVDDTQEKEKALRLQLLREGLLIAAVLPDSPLSPDSLDLPTGEVIALYNRTNTALDLGGLVLNVKQANGAQSLSLPAGTTLAARSVLRVVYGTPSNAAAVRTTLNLDADEAILWHTSLTLQDNSGIKVYVSDAFGNTITGFGIEAQAYKNTSFNPATYIAGRARPAVVQAINKEALEKATEVVSLSKFFDMTSLFSKEEIEIQAKLAEQSKAEIATSLDMLKEGDTGVKPDIAIKGIFSRGYKIYEFTNHLGNVLLTLSDKVVFDGTTYTVNTISATDYQPFGAEMSLRTFNASAYRYGFNGKENDRSWGGKWIQDYGFRLYNPSIARFLSVDPLTVSYPWYTPYQFAGNMPISAIDLDGAEPQNATTGDGCGTSDGMYTIQKGDTFWALENKWNLEHGALESYNSGVDPKNLKVGQVIKGEADVPVNSPPVISTTSTESQPSVSSEASGGYMAQAFAAYCANPYKYTHVATAALASDDAAVVGFIDDILIPVLYTAAVITDVSCNYPAFSQTHTKAEAEAASKNENGKSFYYVTYTKTNPTNGLVYVGRSCGYGTPEQVVKDRDNSGHHMDGEGYGKAVLSNYLPATIPGGYAVRAADPAYWAIRGSEQLQIEHYRRLGIAAPQINGVGPANANGPGYMKAAKEAIRRGLFEE